MKKFFADLVLYSSILIFLSSSGLYLYQQNSKNREVPVSKDDINKYASGSCSSNTNCTPQGCSGEICTSKKGLVTTCIYSEDYPDKNFYTCGCLETKCAWFKK